MYRRPIVGYDSQTRTRLIAYTVCISLLLLLLGVLQVTVCARISVFGATPDLMLCAVLGVSFFLGRYAGAITGIGAGFLIEAMGSTGISLLPLVYLLLGYLGGHYARVIVPKRYTAYLVYLLPALLLRAGITLTYICLSYESFSVIQILLRTLLPEAADTAICGAILYFPIKLLCVRLMRKK